MIKFFATDMLVQVFELFGEHGFPALLCIVVVVAAIVLTRKSLNSSDRRCLSLEETNKQLLDDSKEERKEERKSREIQTDRVAEAMKEMTTVIRAINTQHTTPVIQPEVTIENKSSSEN